MSISGIILAGGKSSRMGKDKGLIKFGEKMMIEYALDTIQELTDSIMIIANSNDYSRFRLPVYSDLVKDTGPIGGIYTGLTYSKTERNIVVSCDTPFINKSLLKELLLESNGCDILVPVHNGQLHPLIGVYSKNCLPTLETAIKTENYKLRDLFDKVNTKIYNASHYPEHLFTNINTVEELNAHS